MTLKQNMQTEAKTIGDFEVPSRNASLVRASFRIAHNYGIAPQKHLQKPRMWLAAPSFGETAKNFMDQIFSEDLFLDNCNRICVSQNFMNSKVTFKSTSLIEMIIELKAVCREMSYSQVCRLPKKVKNFWCTPIPQLSLKLHNITAKTVKCIIWFLWHPAPLAEIISLRALLMCGSWVL